jgi:hypothetical protein
MVKLAGLLLLIVSLLVAAVLPSKADGLNLDAR